MLALGAKSYSVLDRFPGDYCGKNSIEWYTLLKTNWKYASWPEDLNIENWVTSAMVNLYNLSVECFVPKQTFDIVCSKAVGEHILDHCCPNV
jgi:hypothetical protein